VTPAVLPEVVSFLRSLGEEVEVIETHISMVFLTDERAYKVKKPVKFPYLDYSTLALREKLSREEVRLNRRTAPSLYLGVKAVTKEADGSLAFDGAGEAIEWVVEMEKFDQADYSTGFPSIIRWTGDRWKVLLKRLRCSIARRKSAKTRAGSTA